MKLFRADYESQLRDGFISTPNFINWLKVREVEIQIEHIKKTHPLKSEFKIIKL